MKTYNVKLASISPMLHHGAQSVGLDITSKTKGGNAVVGDPEEWKKTIYYDENIGVYLPAMNLEAAFIEAGKQFKVSGRKTAMAYIKSGLFINEDKLPFYVNGNIIKNLDDVKIDRRTVKNPSTKGRNTRYRAIFDNWTSEFIMTISSDDYLSTEILRDIIDYAGMYVGIGDYRPRFGRFKLVELKKV